MEQAEVEKLCETLMEIVAFGPGENSVALDKVRSIAEKFPTKNAYVHEKLVAIVEDFTVWLSRRTWNKGGDSGERIRSFLYADISKLQSAMWTLNNAKNQTP